MDGIWVDIGKAFRPTVFFLLTPLGLHRPKGWGLSRVKKEVEYRFKWMGFGKTIVGSTKNIHKIHDTNLMWWKVPFQQKLKIFKICGWPLLLQIHAYFSCCGTASFQVSSIFWGYYLSKNKQLQVHHTFQTKTSLAHWWPTWSHSLPEKLPYIYIFYQHLPRGANKTLRDGKLVPFRNHLAPFGRSRYVYFWGVREVWIPYIYIYININQAIACLKLFNMLPSMAPRFSKHDIDVQSISKGSGERQHQLSVLQLLRRTGKNVIFLETFNHHGNLRYPPQCQPPQEIST